jgi:hypothetical protein
MSAILAFEKPGKPVLRGIEHYWSVIRKLDDAGSWSVHDVHQQTSARERATIANFVARLVAAGMAVDTGETRRVREKHGRPGPLYRLSGPKPARAPRLRRDGTPASQGRGQQQMWNVMRGSLGRDGFTFHDLALWGSTDTVVVATATAKKYVQHLADAGYLLALRKGTTGKAALWRLKPAMNTGPRPPLILAAKIVYDPNRKAAAPFEAVEVAP